ncbi:MAG: hypothetical protein WCG44_04140 [bacterium]
MAKDELYMGPDFGEPSVTKVSKYPYNAGEQAAAFGVPLEDITVEVAPGLEVLLAIARALEDQQAKMVG